MKNLKINRKKLASILLAMGISLNTMSGTAEIISYNTKTTLSNGQEAMIYFITGDTVNDYAYVSIDNQVGYVSLDNVNIPDEINYDYTEINEDMLIDTERANIYVSPNVNSTIKSTFFKDKVVHVVAKSNNGWYIISDNSVTGFIEGYNLKTTKEEKAIYVTGNNVNIRTSTNTKNKDNIIGSANVGDSFTITNHENGWYTINYYGQNAYISDKYAKETNNILANQQSEVLMAKITGNNVNIRSSASTKTDNVIGFADVTDCFKIIDKQNEWYIIDYLGQTGYISSKYVNEKMVNQEDLRTLKMISLTCDSALYSDTNGTYISTLPAYQYMSVIKEENGYYKVCVDGITGYINKKNTSNLSKTFVGIDLARQIVRVYKNNKEVYRCHMISGRKNMPTEIGSFKIGHMLTDYQLTPEYVVKYWIQYNKNIGLHDAYWQKPEYFIEVARRAYEAFAKGKGKTYADYHPSHGCNNLQDKDIEVIWNIVNVGDNVIVIGPNNLIKDRIIGSIELNEILLVRSLEKEEQKIKKLV